MGSVQQIRVKWNHHQSNFPKVFDSLLHKSDFVDVTLSCEGHSLKAHKLVLSACSPYFHNLFVENPCKHPIVIMRDFRYSEIEAIVEYMYKGEVNISRDSLREFLRTAQSLQVKGLADDESGQHDGTDLGDERGFNSQTGQGAQTESVPEVQKTVNKHAKATLDATSLQRETFNHPPPTNRSQNQHFQPTPNKRMRIEKPVVHVVQPAPQAAAAASVTENAHAAPPPADPDPKSSEVSETLVKIEVKGEQQDYDTQDSAMDDNAEMDQNQESPEPDTIILGDDPEVIEEEPDIMFAHSNSSHEGSLSQSDSLSSSLLSALRESGAGPSTSNAQATGEGPWMARRSAKRSRVWYYFDDIETDDTRVRCRTCGMPISIIRKRDSIPGCTSNLTKHLKRKHPNEHFQLLEFKNRMDSELLS